MKHCRPLSSEYGAGLEGNPGNLDRYSKSEISACQELPSLPLFSARILCWTVNPPPSSLLFLSDSCVCCTHPNLLSLFAILYARKSISLVMSLVNASLPAARTVLPDQRILFADVKVDKGAAFITGPNICPHPLQAHILGTRRDATWRPGLQYTARLLALYTSLQRTPPTRTLFRPRISHEPQVILRRVDQSDHPTSSL